MPTFRYRHVTFKLDVLATDVWRWTILPQRVDGIFLVGQFVGAKSDAITYCRNKIDDLLDDRQATSDAAEEDDA